jgi:hypothetical protein
MKPSPDVRPVIVSDNKGTSLQLQQLTGENAAWIPTVGCKDMESALGLWQHMTWLLLHEAFVGMSQLQYLICEAEKTENVASTKTTCVLVP